MRTWFVRYKTPVVVVLCVLALTPMFLASPTQADLSLTVATMALIALSTAMTYGQAGILSLAQGTFAAIGAYTTAILMSHHEISPWIGLFFALLVPAFVGYLVSWFLLRLSPLILALSTLLVSEVITMLIQHGGDVTGGFVGIVVVGAPAPFFDPVQSQLIAWGLVVVVATALIHIHHSQQGRALRTIGFDPELARSLGISPRARSTVLFALASAVAGLAGWLYALTRGVVAPEALTVMLSFTAFIMIMLGGAHTIIGPILGAVLLTTLDRNLPGEELQGLLYGTVVVAVMVLLPKGIAGTNWPELLARWRGSPPRGGRSSEAQVEQFVGQEAR